MAATPVPRPIQDIETDLRNKTTSAFRTVFHSPLGVPDSQVPLYMDGGRAYQSNRDSIGLLTKSSSDKPGSKFKKKK